MKKIDVSGWKEFRVEDLLGSAGHGVYVNPHTLAEDDNGYFIVSASTQNNGVGSVCYSADTKYMLPSKVITWGKQSPFFAYQVNATISGQGVYYYSVNDLSECAALFLCSVMQSTVNGRYDYSECLIGSKMDGEIIKLPATEDGEPDWDYMESYMRSVMDREAVFAEHLASLTAEAVADGRSRR